MAAKKVTKKKEKGATKEIATRRDDKK